MTTLVVSFQPELGTTEVVTTIFSHLLRHYHEHTRAHEMVLRRFFFQFGLFACFVVLSRLIYSGASSLADKPDSNSLGNPPSEIRNSLKGVLVNSVEVNSIHLKQWKMEGLNTVVLLLSEKEPGRQVQAAAYHIRSSGLHLYYWIEIARHPVMAEEHPEWMASLQGHQEWRRHSPTFPEIAEGEVVKNYPWVPILYQEAFEAHLKRISLLVKNLPTPQGVFLNDLQAAPSACGCGNWLCRWTPDYGPVKTATKLPASAAAKFATAVGKLMPKSRIIPVWTTECEEPDGAKDGACAGVGCFSGLCWQGPPVSADRLISVLQGWDVTSEQRSAQIQQCEKAGAAGFVLALTKIEQGWEPRIFKVP